MKVYTTTSRLTLSVAYTDDIAQDGRWGQVTANPVQV